MLPKEMIKEFVGKVCHISVFDSAISSYVKILEVEENWIKTADEKNNISLINGDMVKSIHLAPEKYQKKFEK
jgi:hypothetical protein